MEKQINWREDLFWEEIEGDKELAQELLQMFLTSAQRLLEEIEGSLAKGDLSLAREKAHSLKGAAGTIYCEGLSKEARAFEQITSLEEARLRLSRLKELFQSFKHQIESKGLL